MTNPTVPTRAAIPPIVCLTFATSRQFSMFFGPNASLRRALNLEWSLCPAQHAPGPRVSCLAPVCGELAVDEHRSNSFRHLIRFFKCAAIDDRPGIEEHDIGF